MKKVFCSLIVFCMLNGTAFAGVTNWSEINTVDGVVVYVRYNNHKTYTSVRYWVVNYNYYKVDVELNDQKYKLVGGKTQSLSDMSKVLSARDDYKFIEFALDGILDSIANLRVVVVKK